MPLIFEKIHEDSGSKIAVWEKTESDEELLACLELDSNQKARLEEVRASRKREWLCSRMLIDQLFPDKDYKLFKDSFGKPFIVNSNYFISLSHTDNKAAAIVSKKIVGIDIQNDVKKIDRIYPKFISQLELGAIDEEHRHESYQIFWSAKEAMYKAYGKKKLEFRKHMHLYAFKYYQDNLQLCGWVHKNETKQDYCIFTEKIQDCYLVYAILR
jgi:phosphopantetheinyl transferase